MTASDACGQTSSPVVRGAFPERVLFATASNQPAPGAAGVLDLLAERIRHDVPGSEVTVLGHTDAIGSDAYNMDLSRRRAVTVLRGLLARGLDPERLSAVAIGKRQPIADNDTDEGRAKNRRVEFLVSPCLAANLQVIQAQPSAGAAAATPVEVGRLNPLDVNRLRTVDTVSLRQPGGEQPMRATVAPTGAGPRPALQPPAAVARPAPAPHYQPKTLLPDAQPNSLGPAVPF